MPSHNQNSFPALQAIAGNRRRLSQAHQFGKSDQSQDIAAIYNEAGDEYAAYADGGPENLFVFNGLHAYADRYVWAVLDAKLSSLRASGASSVGLLDAGCGPGTWLRRLVIRARELGFTAIRARGFDFAEAQSDRARFQAADLASLPGVNLSFDVADLGAPLPEAAASVDLALCLYSVLSHLPRPALAGFAAEIGRVTSGSFITTVRPIGSVPTLSVASMEKAVQFKLDHREDVCKIDFRDGRHIAMSFHLFTAAEFRSYFADHFEIEDLRGLDLFHGRFAPDPRWNPPYLTEDRSLEDELSRLEEAYSASPAFMDRATHLLLTARRRAQ